MTQVTSFFDETLGLYVYTTPLKVSSQVLDAAKKIAIKVQWDSDGFICGLTHTATIAICEKLGIVLLSVKEFMALVKRHPDIASHQFAEWFIDSFIMDEEQNYTNGEGTNVELPFGRPGWFRLEEIDEEGIPNHVQQRNSLGLWKYWSPNETNMVSGALRSFVTSSGTCSLDLGIPATARHPKIMIRECYRSSKPVNTSAISDTWKKYMHATQSCNDKKIRRYILSLDLDSIQIGRHENTLLNHKEEEMLVNLKGKRLLLTENYQCLNILGIESLIKMLCMKPDDNTTFVVGHKNPDADSVISAIFEALRRNAVYCANSTLPWIPSIPVEVSNLFTADLQRALLAIPMFKPHKDIILVDCQTFTYGSKSQVKAVIDHHNLTEIFPDYVAVSHENSWSSTIQVYIKLIGSGFDLDPDLSRILLEATLLEAEPELLERSPVLDQLAINRLRNIVKVPVRDYGSLLSLSDDIQSPSDLSIKFKKDYRETNFGFAVVHCMYYQDFSHIAEENNMSSHLPVTIVKQVLCNDKPPWVESEYITIHFNQSFHDNGFREAIRDVISLLVRLSMTRSSKFSETNCS